jgi:hypothetical protein
MFLHVCTFSVNFSTSIPRDFKKVCCQSNFCLWVYYYYCYQIFTVLLRFFLDKQIITSKLGQSNLTLEDTVLMIYEKIDQFGSFATSSTRSSPLSKEEQDRYDKFATYTRILWSHGYEHAPLIRFFDKILMNFFKETWMYFYIYLRIIITRLSFYSLYSDFF